MVLWFGYGSSPLVPACLILIYGTLMVGFDGITEGGVYHGVKDNKIMWDCPLN